MSGHSSKKKPPPTQRKCERKLIKARHEESARLTEFDIFALRENGEEDAVIGGGSFEGVNLENATAMLTQLAHSLGCELEWESFANVSPEESMRRQHLLEKSIAQRKMEYRNE
jgi:hypothetical protein